jgi:hypothetical protein
MRPLIVLVLAALTASPLRAAEPTASAELATGLRLVQEGDYENAVTTLQAVTRQLAGQAARRLELAQAYLYLGIAHVALDQRDPAKTAFRAALAQNEALRLSEERFSPKVIATFEEARREAESAAAATAGPAPEGGGGRPLLWVALGGAAAGAVVLATRGEDAGAGTVTVSNARFTQPVIECPNGSVDVPLPYSVLVDVDNRTTRQLTVAVQQMVAVIVVTSIPSEMGFSSTRPATVVPGAVGAQTRATLRVESTLLCGNGPGDPARSNTWTARITFSTSAGVFHVETTDRMRVDVP